MTKQDEIDLKATVNNLLVQTATNTVKVSILQSMTLGIFKELLDKEPFKNAYTQYVNLLEEAVNDVVSTIEPLLFDINDPAFLIRQRFDAHSLISEMKNSEDYISDSGQ